MSVHSSSSSNASLPPPALSSTPSNYSVTQICLKSTVATFNITVFTIICILVLLPLCISVLYLGLQRWRQQRSNTTTSHSDLFTYHIVVTELLNLLSFTVACCGVHMNSPHVTVVGFNLYSGLTAALMLFHLLTCVERYLAVVHPVTYLSLRNEKGIRIRKISIGCVWLVCIAWIGVSRMDDYYFVTIFEISIIAVILTAVSFCSLSVLCVLIRPGPGEGEGGRAKQQVDQSKLRAFYTIMAILGVLLLRFGGFLTATGLYMSAHLGEAVRCGMSFTVIWFCLPGSLVSPLLFLHRAGKLPCCKINNESG